MNAHLGYPDRPRRLLRVGQVCSMVGLGKTSIYALIEEDRFPRPHKIGRISRWLESEVNDWIDQLVCGGTWRPRSAGYPGQAGSHSLDPALT